MHDKTTAINVCSTPQAIELFTLFLPRFYENLSSRSKTQDKFRWFLLDPLNDPGVHKNNVKKLKSWVKIGHEKRIFLSEAKMARAPGEQKEWG